MPPQRIAYSSPFVPAEWIAAHGLRPYRLFPATHTGAFPAGTTEGLCPYAKAFAEEAAADAAAVIFATTCDQMRRASELLAGGRPMFLFNVPATYHSGAPLATYREELARLGRFLTRVGGTPPEPAQLAAVMRRYDDARAALRNARPAMSARAAAEALIALHQEGPAAVRAATVRERSEPLADARGSDDSARAARATGNGMRLALLGGPLFRDHYNLYDELEAAGVRVVLDATETGERTLPAPFEAASLQRDPVGELARAYFGTIPDAFRRPNTLLYEWLDRELAARRVQGILLLRCVWCDVWHAEAARVKERFHLPVAEMDPSGTAAVGPRKESRLQALLEIFT